MSKNLFEIKSRIFKKERIRDDKNDLIIIPNKKTVSNRNQLELSWHNIALESAHLTIVGKVFLKEWERRFNHYSVSRCFIQEPRANQHRLYLSFQVSQSLNSKEIKELLSASSIILEECLVKIVNKLGIEIVVREEVSLKQTKEESVPKVEETEEDKIIKKLHQDIEEQEQLLVQLTAKQTSQHKRPKNEEKLNQLKEQEIFFDQQEKKYLVAELNRKDDMIKSLKEDINSLTQEVSELTDEIKTNNQVNRQLDKANIKLNDRLNERKIDAERLEKVSELETTVRNLHQENSDYRIKINESQSMTEKYRNQVKQLSQSLENGKKAQEELLEKAQFDYEKLDKSLLEAEKKLILEINERQKAEIQLEELRANLAVAKRQNEEQERKNNKLVLDVSNQLELREKAINQEELVQQQLDDTLEELKMSEATNKVLKAEIYELEYQKEKWDQLDEWQIKYQELVEQFSHLETESLSYRQEVGFLTSQLNMMEDKLEENEKELDYYLSQRVAIEPEVKKANEEKIEWQATIIDDYDIEYEEDFYYEADPFIEEVMAEELINAHKEDQIADEKKIKELLKSYYDEYFHDIKISKSDYRKAVLGFKFLGFRWSQVLIMDDADKNADFLEWCKPFINKMDAFEEELSLDVKKSFFSKNYVTIDESTYNILKGYSELSTYLDTYYLKVSYYIDKYFLNEGNR
ncbi:MAG: hypothetical protein RR494_03025 [Vagococcus sp.]|uniref:hypothetical protein n=1 Tax=Vagococcus TaxID=2737 RepID=UPI002FCAD206